MLEYMVQGCNGARTAFPHLFHVLFQNGYFLDAFPHLFVSTTSLSWFDFQLLMGTIDWLFQWPIECM